MRPILQFVVLVCASLASTLVWAEHASDPRLQPRAIEPAELDRIEYLLSLSTAQRRALLYHFDRYRSQYNRMPDFYPAPDVDLDTLTKLIEYWKKEEQAYLQQQRFIEQLDVEFFASLEPMLTDEQQAALPLVMALRQRQRLGRFEGFFRNTRRPFPQLDQLLLEAVITTGERLPDDLLNYSEAITRRLATLDAEVLTLGRRVSERWRAELEIEQFPMTRTDRMESIELAVVQQANVLAREIDQLNRQWAEQWAVTLSPCLATELLYQFGTQRYHGSSPIWRPLRSLNATLCTSTTDAPPHFAQLRFALIEFYRMTMFPQLKSMMDTIDESFPLTWPQYHNFSSGESQRIMRRANEERNALSEEIFAMPYTIAEDDEAEALKEFMIAASRLASQRRRDQSGDGNARPAMHALYSSLAWSPLELRTIAGRLSNGEAHSEIIALLIQDYAGQMAELLRQTPGSTPEDIAALIDPAKEWLEQLRLITDDREDQRLIDLALLSVERAPLFATNLQSDAWLALDPLRFLLTDSFVSRVALLTAEESLDDFHQKTIDLLRERKEVSASRDPQADDSQRLQNMQRIGRINAQVAQSTCELMDQLRSTHDELANACDRMLRVALPQAFGPRDSLAGRFAILRDAAPTVAAREQMDEIWLDYLERDDTLLSDLLDGACSAHLWTQAGPGVWVPMIGDAMDPDRDRLVAVVMERRDLRELTDRHLAVLAEDAGIE